MDLHSSLRYITIQCVAMVKRRCYGGKLQEAQMAEQLDRCSFKSANLFFLKLQSEKYSTPAASVCRLITTAASYRHKQQAKAAVLHASQTQLRGRCGLVHQHHCGRISSSKRGRDDSTSPDKKT